MIIYGLFSMVVGAFLWRFGNAVDYWPLLYAAVILIAQGGTAVVLTIIDKIREG